MISKTFPFLFGLISFSTSWKKTVSSPRSLLRSVWLSYCLYFPGSEKGHCQLKLVNFEAEENHVSHDTHGLSKKHLVVRRGKPFKVTLLFGSNSWDPHTDILCLEVWLGIEDSIIVLSHGQKTQ